jgi:hypothetical protein
MLVPVPRAGGPPSTSTLLFALLLPLSLLLGTVFATLRVGEQLDQKFLEEVNRLCRVHVIMKQNWVYIFLPKFCFKFWMNYLLKL